MNRWIKMLLVVAVLGGAWMMGTEQTAEAHRWGVAYVGPAPYYAPAYGYYYAPVPRRAFYGAAVVPYYGPPLVPVPPVPPIPYYVPHGPTVFFGW